MNQKVSLTKFIAQLEKELPSLCRVKDLIKVGIMGSGPSASRFRAEGSSPNYFRFSDKFIRYLKADVIDWVKRRYISGGKENSAPLMKWVNAKIERPEIKTPETVCIFYSIEEKVTMGWPLFILKEDESDEEISELMFQDLDDMKIKEATYWMPLLEAPSVESLSLD